MSGSMRSLVVVGLTLCCLPALGGQSKGAGSPQLEALVTGYHLRPVAATAYVGGTVDLQLVYCTQQKVGSRPAKPGKPDDELNPLVPQHGATDELGLPTVLVCEGDEGVDELAPLVRLDHVVWKVEGPGRIDGSDKVATYHAPASRSSRSKAIVSVSFDYGKEKQILLATIRIEVAPKQYHGKATFNSPVVDASAAADVTWTLVEPDAGSPDAEESPRLVYRPSGTIAGDLKVPGCKPKHLQLRITPEEGDELVIDADEQSYSFTFSSEDELNLSCDAGFYGTGSSVFHFAGGVCKMDGPLTYDDLKSLKGHERCEMGMFGTTSWEFEAVDPAPGPR